MGDYRKRIIASGAITGFGLATVNYIQRDFGFATILLTIACLLVCVLIRLSRPSSGAHVSHAAAQAAAGDGDVILYWRPGCTHCDRLKLGLGRARHDVTWVDVCRDSDAAAFVATHHEGSQSVPTAVTGAGEMINATPASIKAHLASTT